MVTQAQIVNIDMGNKSALIRWETTQNIDYVDIEDLKRFSIDDSVQKKKSTDFYTPPSEKKCID
jgi:hypothetical protein